VGVGETPSERERERRRQKEREGGRKEGIESEERERK
jgi:hypothetical protein